MTMTERPTVQTLNTLGTAGKSDEGDRQQSDLSMTWAIDPATGKLVARWFIEPTESVKIVAFSSAA